MHPNGGSSRRSNQIGKDNHLTGTGNVRRNSRIHGEEAQGLVEFALIISVLMWLFLGTVDFGRFMYYDNAIRSAARVGAEIGNGTCGSSQACGHYTTGTAVNGFILQATVCELQPYVSLKPNPGGTFCTAGINTVATGANPCVSGGQDICDSTLTYCVKDVCIVRSNPSGSPTSGQTVQVIVGYNFVPVTPFIQAIWSNTKCFTPPAVSGAENTHTLCASATGRVY